MNTKSNWVFVLFSAFALLMIADRVTTAQEDRHERGDVRDDQDSYVRVTYDDGQPAALQTAIARFTSKTAKNELFVDLVAAVHVADEDYYRTLNKLFERYDAVLYELVAAPGEEIPDRKSDDNPMRVMHRMMQTVLGLSSQLDQVEYTSDNFVHADMSPAEMSESLKTRGDTPVTFALSALNDILRRANVAAQKVESGQEQPTSSQQDVLSLLTGSGTDLKRELALQLSHLGGSSAPLGPTIGQLLVSDRNAAAMKVLQLELAKGHQRIAIFYGAAHMPDFQKRLQEDFGLVHAKTEWITAWDLTETSTSKTESLLNAFLKILQEE